MMWLLAPVGLPVGSLNRIESLRVTDIFGKTSILKEIKPNGDWAFMQTSDSTHTQWLFTAPGSEVIQQSSPIEKVRFIRDEMANLVWAVEEIVSDSDGRRT